MITFLVILHIFMCIALILIVLLQSGKGAEMGAAFGGASQTVFGGGGPAPFLGKITTIAAVIFMLTSLGLAYFSAHPFGRSLMQDGQTITQPAAGVPAQDAENEQSVGDAPAPVPQALPEEK